jgi:HEAT repeat protein
LTGLLKDGSLFTRDGAALALGVLGDKRAIGPLIEAVADPRNEICDEGRDWARWGAVKALTALTGKNFEINAAEWRRWYSANGGH